MDMATPYDGKISVWHVYGGMISENTIDELCKTLQQYAPAVSAVFVKVIDGTDWMGKFETKPDLAINGPADIARWVSTLAKYNLEFHAWSLPKGIDPHTEAGMMVQVCQVVGVKSLILDVEAGNGFFRGGEAAIRPLMVGLRTALSANFHIGMSMDPRPLHFSEIFPSDWFPFINSIHPQVYWGEFGQTPDASLKDAYTTWGNYGRPIIPVLQAYNIDKTSMDRAHSLAFNQYKAPALSWYVFGGIGPTQFQAVNEKLDGTVVTLPPPVSGTWSNGGYATEIVIKPDSAGYSDGTYDNSPNPLQKFTNTQGWTSKYTATGATGSRVWARWAPNLPTGGFWEVAIYVPSQHATTRNARYKIHGIYGLNTGDFEADTRQAPVDDIWVSLGVYNFVSGDSNAGVIFLDDLTNESGLEIAFDAIRWRQLKNISFPPPYLSDGYDSPLGEAAARMTTKMYPAPWYVSNPYENFYYLGPGQTNPALHTGDDLLTTDGTAPHQPIYATSSGVVTSAERETGSWGNVIVVRNDPVISNGTVLYARYAHVENMQVKKGDRVSRGQYIANVGNAFGRFAYHLHFDLSNTAILYDRPWDWPGTDKKRLEANYIDPYKFLIANRPIEP
jgi:murein DD-endopeptidase MepM/ murein hydrolase activator NlpD